MLNKIKRTDKDNLIFITLIFLLSIVFLHNIISPSKIMDNIHYINDITFVSFNLKESLFKYGQLHLWTPYYYSGRPLYAQPEYYFLDFNFLYILLFRNIFMAMNLAALTYFLLSGLGMYLLFLTFKDNKSGAFIASIIYMFNGYMHSFVITGNLNVIAGYSLIPFAFMFFVKALKSSLFTDYIKNSILSGLFIALQVFSGGTLFIPYEIVLFMAYAFFCVLGKNLGIALKILTVGLVVILAAFSLSAVKLLPGMEFLKLSNRGTGVSYQEYLGHPIELNKVVNIFITNLFSRGGISASVGITAFILLVFSLLNYRKRYVIFALVLIIISFFMATKGTVSDLFFKIPVFNQLRHIERAIFLSAFASSILAGVGFIILSGYIKKIIKINKDMPVFSVITSLILTELLFLQNFPQSTDIVKPNEIPINDFISKDTSRFRTINLALSPLVGASGYNYLAPLGVGTIKGGSGIWFNDYLNYLSIAQQTNPAKLLGLLNNKYVISDKEINISGLNFLNKFEECVSCQIWEAYGPYLYENLEYMPRAFYVENAILVVGDKQNTEQVIYNLLLNKNFDPKKAAIIQGSESISGYNTGELKRYNAIIIFSGINKNDIQLLRDYTGNGGILLPNIFENKNAINERDIENLFNELEDNFEEIAILKYENNLVEYNVSGKKGLLVLSERFSGFPGWKAFGKDEKEILRANGITTALFADNDDKITLKYKPSSFRNGLLISSAAFILLGIYLAYLHTKGGINKNRT